MKHIKHYVHMRVLWAFMVAAYWVDIPTGFLSEPLFLRQLAPNPIRVQNVCPFRGNCIAAEYSSLFAACKGYGSVHYVCTAKQM